MLAAPGFWGHRPSATCCRLSLDPLSNSLLLQGPLLLSVPSLGRHACVHVAGTHVCWPLVTATSSSSKRRRHPSQHQQQHAAAAHFGQQHSGAHCLV